jgi:hypothetical protein
MMRCTMRFQREARHVLRAWPSVKSGVAELRERQLADPEGFAATYKLLGGFHPHEVRRIRVSQTRALFRVDQLGNITLLTVGDRRRVYGDYGPSHINEDLRTVGSPPPWLLTEDSPLFSSRKGPLPMHFGVEDRVEWADYLAFEQARAFDRILDFTARVIDEHKVGHTLLLGGPGTGKTVVLVALLLWAVEYGWSVGISISEEVTSSLRRALSASGRDWDISKYRIDVRRPPPSQLDLLLVDDPATPHTVDSLLRKPQAAYTVIAYDPEQLRSTTGLASEVELRVLLGEPYWSTRAEGMPLSSGSRSRTLLGWVEQDEPGWFHTERLSVCYRQRENLSRLVSGLSDRLADIEALHKPGRKSHRALLKFRTVLPGGEVREVLDATPGDVEGEVERLIRLERPLWTWATPLLVGVDERCGDIPARLASQLSGIDHKLVALRQDPKVDLGVPHIESIKGVDFQHAFVFLGLELHSWLQRPDPKTPGKQMEQRRLLRIPLSRPRDTMTVFVLESSCWRHWGDES